MEPNISSSLADKLNQSTPHAPRDADEVAARMAAASSSHSAPGADSREDTPRSSASPGEAIPTGVSRVYVPTVRPVAPGENPEYELRVLEDGSAGLAVYTSVDVLKECLGADQAWSEAAVLELLYLVGQKRVGVALNPRLSPDLTQGRRGQPGAVS